MKPTNFMLITSDEHTRRALGCYGHPLVKTPNLDRLAADGTLFRAAYTNSPLCTPSRSSFATGRYVHELGCWDNCQPWDGSTKSWGHRAQEGGHRSVSIGKLHYQRDDSHGFDEEVLPMYLSNDGLGDGIGLLRKLEVPYRSPEREFGPGGPIAINGPKMMSDAIGRGESNHTDYDRRITKAACAWLRENGGSEPENPWVLYVSFVAPHFPLIAPAEFYDLYPLDAIPQPLQYANHERPRHPVVRALNRIWNYDDYFDDEKMRRARAGYYGLCSFLDHNIGLLLAALNDGGAGENTRIIYTSDHGECLGDRGTWSTSAMYEESVGVPMILHGPDIPKGKEVAEVVSLVDLYPTIVEAIGESLGQGEADLPGHSLIDIANGDVPDRTVLSEYHAGGSITGAFMIRSGKWKYIHYVDYAPQLFDLDADPDELNDLGEDPAHIEIRTECEAKLRAMLNPEEINAMAFADQAAKIAEHGGVEAILSREYTWGGHSIDTHVDENGVITTLDESSPLRRVLQLLSP